MTVSTSTSPTTTDDTYAADAATAVVATAASAEKDELIRKLEASLNESRMVNEALEQEVQAHRSEKETREIEMQEALSKFDRLSAQAFSKIKELLSERKIMEVEIEALKGQVERLETVFGGWVGENS